ncbi:MAG: hypothetical protein A3B44_04370 [Candidatus Levybacteria bacterium RIFCSPLOWO2_01_FULL_38_21]|nr:MAG: hypothetical protein A3B44_04370 [Candidatus Levybacteria bacterium RIFCSPLOWO2_01_FULL_38_21]
MSTKLKKLVKGKVAVFIDAANLELSAKDRGWKVDYRKLYKWIKEADKLKYIGFFTVRFNSKSHDAFLTLLKKTGYKLVTKPLKVIKDKSKTGHTRKANFDVEIAIETMKQIDSFDTMMLFSGDSDFDYLLKELKKKDKKVIVVSTKYHISRELIKRADAYIDLRKIKKLIERKP